MEERLEFCRGCGILHAISSLSIRGLCAQCAKQRIFDAIRQMQTKHGPLWEKWRRNYIASTQATILRLEKETQEND